MTNSSGFYTSTSARMEDIIKALVIFIVKTMNSLSLVADESFINLVKILDPRVKLPGRHALTQTHLPRIYHHAKTKLTRILESVSLN